MALESGIYIISCRGSESYIGRNTIEDKSLLPKRIVSLPKGVEAPRFIVEKSRTSEDCYIIRAMEGLVAEKDGLLWAFLIHEMAPPTTTWLINPQPQHGQNVYIVEKPNRSAGWTVPDKKPETQVAVKPLPATKSQPPQFSPEALFEFVRIDRD